MATWNVGDKIVNVGRKYYGKKATVAKVSRGIVVYVNAKDQASANFTSDELYRRNWRIDVGQTNPTPAPRLTVLTLAQIAAQNGIPVSQLRIKD